MRLHVGTSGFSYDEWQGCFYPQGLAARDRLAYYASQLGAVEINNSFYRTPKKSVVEGWAAQVPADFRFAFKAAQRVTHQKRLREVAADTDHMLEAFAGAGEKQGCVLVQLPPNFRKDRSRLVGFLEHLPPAVRAAFEFRNPTWFDEEIYAALRARNAALVASDVDDQAAPPLVATADWGYLRLRRTAYSNADLERWLEALRAQPWQETFVFFKHEDAGTGPKLAAEFRARFEQVAG
jgi:uncharacterized protein YecE (DUF72 family)